MINPEDVFYLETGEKCKILCITEFGAAQQRYDNNYVHWLESKYRDFIVLQTGVNKNV